MGEMYIILIRYPDKWERRKPVIINVSTHYPWAVTLASFSWIKNTSCCTHDIVTLMTISSIVVHVDGIWMTDWLHRLVGWWGCMHSTPREESKTRFITLSTEKKVKENILLQRRRWAGGHRVSETGMHGCRCPFPKKKKKVEYTLSFLSPYQQQRSPVDHGAIRVLCSTSCHIIYPHMLPRLGKGKRKGSVPEKKRLLWADSWQQVPVWEEQGKKLLNSTVYTPDCFSAPGLPPKGNQDFP